MVRVPCGTLVYEISSDETGQKKTFLADLNLKNKRYLGIEGGVAGKGNKNHPFMPS